MVIDWSALPGKPVGEPEGVPMHFGDLAAELSAANDDQQSVFALTTRAWLRFEGKDAGSFLHNQLTSDVVHLSPGHWQHSAWCTAKGRMLANFVLVRRTADSCFELCLPLELLPPLVKRFRMYILRSDVAVTDLSGNFLTFGLKGNHVGDNLMSSGFPVPESVGNVTSFEHGWIVRTAKDRCLITIRAELAKQTVSTLLLNAKMVGLEAWQWIEIVSGVPLVLKSTQEEFIPQMVNFDKIGGVSFHKGCYPGQEVVARTQYLGKVKRHLYSFHSAHRLEPGQTLYQASREPEGTGTCGIVANSAASPHGGWDGLAVILESAIGADIHVNAPNGPNISNIDLVAA